MVVVEVVVGILGGVVVLAVLASAVRTVVVPRGERVLISRFVFVGIRHLFRLGVRRARTDHEVDAVMARYAPFALMVLPFAWAVAIMGGFAAVFWSLHVRPLRDAVVLSGSSLTTLGFRSTNDLPTLLLAVLEALIGLGLIALLISFLPTMYGHFSRREATVSRFFMRSNDPEGYASPATLLIRAHAVDALDEMGELWEEWERWFVELEETHTSFPALAFFRSPSPERSWVTGAGMALDTAALYVSAVDRPWTPRAPLMIRSGFLALRRVADFFAISYDPDPAPGDAISVGRDEFDAVFDRLAAAGLPMRADRDAAWHDFVGWRVNYDTVLLALCGLTLAPPAPWSSDRAPSLPTRLVRRR